MNTRTATVLTLASLTLIVGACDRDSRDRDRAQANSPSNTYNANNTNPNNANSSTSSSNSSTSGQYSTNSENRITADIRRAIRDDTSLSANARNCTIMADNSGNVTLKGTVASQAEKDSIESKSKSVAGVNRVVNELEVRKY